MGHLLLRALPVLLLVLAAACETVPIHSADAGGMPGETLYRRSCARCHSLYMPTSFTAGEWKYFVRKYGTKARLDKDEKAMVYAYLKDHSLPG